MISDKINPRSVKNFITGKYFIFVLLVFVFAFFAISAPALCTTESIRNILVNASLTAISGCGMTFAITLGGFDLSVGSIMALSTCIIAKTIPMVGIPAAILFAFLVASLIGVINGLIITKLKIQTFVATLATQVIIKGIALIYTGGLSVSVFSYTQLKAFSSARILGIPLPVIIMLFVFLASQFLYSRCRFGVYLRAAGSNEKGGATFGSSCRQDHNLGFCIDCGDRLPRGRHNRFSGVDCKCVDREYICFKRNHGCRIRRNKLVRWQRIFWWHGHRGNYDQYH